MKFFEEDQTGVGNEYASVNLKRGFQQTTTICLLQEMCYVGVTDGGDSVEQTSWSLIVPGESDNIILSSSKDDKSESFCVLSRWIFLQPNC